MCFHSPFGLGKILHLSPNSGSLCDKLKDGLTKTDRSRQNLLKIDRGFCRDLSREKRSADNRMAVRAPLKNSGGGIYRNHQFTMIFNVQGNF